MSATDTHSQPSPEWIARELLSIGVRQMFSRTLARGRPLARWRIPHLVGNVYAELQLTTSGEVLLRVRDEDADEVLTQSEPGDFTAVDMQAVKAAQLFRNWQEERASISSRGDGAHPVGRA